jgi:hypothetical protein
MTDLEADLALWGMVLAFAAVAVPTIRLLDQRGRRRKETAAAAVRLAGEVAERLLLGAFVPEVVADHGARQELANRRQDLRLLVADKAAARLVEERLGEIRRNAERVLRYDVLGPLGSEARERLRKHPDYTLAQLLGREP